MRTMDGNNLRTRSFVALIAVALCAGVAMAETETVGLSGSDWSVTAVMSPGMDGSVSIGGGARNDEDILGFWGGELVVDGNTVGNYDPAATYQVELSAMVVGGQCICGVRVLENGQVIYAGSKTIGPGAETASASGESVLSLTAN